STRDGRCIGDADGLLVADYGRGIAASTSVRAALTERRRRVPVVWDPHPRGAAPIPNVTIATPNCREASVREDASMAQLVDAANAYAGEHSCGAVALTCGRRGVVLVGI